jgi:hypothetical protein
MHGFYDTVVPVVVVAAVVVVVTAVVAAVVVVAVAVAVVATKRKRDRRAEEQATGEDNTVHGDECVRKRSDSHETTVKAASHESQRGWRDA